nr:MAG TPA: hypothetical protein [Caudoviricetes sp.]
MYFLKFPPTHRKTPRKSFILRHFSMINICISHKKTLPLYSINWGFILSNVEFKIYPSSSCLVRLILFSHT